MKNLQVSQAKPNPTGKDKYSSGISKPEQLLGEWVDVKNIGNEAVPLSSLKLSHRTFLSNCTYTGRDEAYWVGSGIDLLQPNKTIRIYTGRRSDAPLMNPADRLGADLFAFAEKSNFVLNNKCGDTITVTWQSTYGTSQSDAASYDPNPPEGVVLKRNGSKLIQTTWAR